MTTVNITVYNDSDFYQEFQYVTMLDNTPISLVNSSMEMMLRRHPTDEAAALRLATDTGEIRYSDPANGLFTVLIRQETLERLGLGDFSQSNIMTQAGPTGLRIEIWSGTFTNNAGPTR
jgi:hypothetical protein